MDAFDEVIASLDEDDYYGMIYDYFSRWEYCDDCMDRLFRGRNKY